MGALDFHLLAASLRSDAVDLASLVRVLTGVLGQALPEGMVEVERDRSLADRLAGRPGEPVRAVVHLQGHDLVLRQERTGPAAEVHQVVRGVVLSRRRVDLDAWLEQLAAGLTAVAAGNARATEALGRLLGG